MAPDQTLQDIEQDPLRFAKSEFSTQDIEIRVALIRRFNYVIHFAVDKREIQIVSVAHAADLGIGFVGFDSVCPFSESLAAATLYRLCRLGNSAASLFTWSSGNNC